MRIINFQYLCIIIITKTNETKMKKNIQTFLAGLLAGAPIAADALVEAYNNGAFTGKSGAQLCLGVGIILLGAFSKYKKTTGGTIAQTTEAKERIK